MSAWDEVKTGYDSDEETVNFGSRHIVEADNGSFECITVATFGSAVQVQSSPSLKALANTETCVVSVSHTLSFLDVSSKTHTGSLKFNSSIKSLTLSADNKFLFLCNQEGTFYIIYVPTRRIEFERSLLTGTLNETPNFCQILLHQKSNGVTVAIVVCEDGTIFCVDNIDLAMLNKTSALPDNISVNKYNVPKSIKVSSAVLIGDDDDDCPQFLLAGNALALCTVSTDILTQFYLPLKEPFYINKLQASSDLSVIFALQTDGKIWELCPFTMMLLGVVDFNFRVKDFILMEDLERNVKEFLTLSQTDNDTATEVKLFNYEDMKNIFNIPLQGVLSLVPVTTLVDEALFLQGEYQDNQLQKVLLRTITKSNPEFRLQRLLRQRKFEEARLFAVQHNLDIQLVHREEAAYCVSQMSPWNSDVPRNDGKNEIDASRLIFLLEQISDIDFVVKCCLKATPPNILQTREVLTYARKHIFDQCQKGQDYPQLQTLVCNHIQLLDTFEIIKEDLHPKNWLNFTTLNLLNLCVEYLHNNELGCAVIVWLRHESDLLPQILAKDIVKTLDMIPTSSDIAPLLSFLSAFLPGILSTMPSMLSDIITWLHNKTGFLEWDCAPQWPQVALDFCERSLQILQPPASEGASHWLVHLHQQHSQPDSPLRQLQQTKSALVDLLYLQTHFGIVLSTEEYIQPDKTHVCHLLLKKTPASKMQELLNNLIRQIVLENNLDFEEIITSYIENTIREQSWWYHENIPCENELITLIRFLKNIERTLTCIVLMLKAAPVPWSDKLIQLVQEFENCGHHRTAEIKQEMNALVVKLVLKKYQLSEMFNSINMVYEQLVRHILKQGNSESLEDALKVVHLNPLHIESVHSIYLEHLLEAGNYRTAHNHLKCLPTKLQLQVCQRMLIKIDLMLKEDWDYDELGCYVAFLEPTLTCLRDASDAGNTKGDLQMAASIAAKITRNKYLLRKLCFGSSFGTSHFYHQVTSASMFIDDSEKVKFYLEHVNQSLELPSEVLLIKTKGIAQLLQLQELEALLLLVEAACTASHFSVAVEALRSLNTMPRHVTKTEVNILIRLVKTLLPCFQEIASADPNFLPILEQALCVFIAHCNLDQTGELIALLNSLQFANVLATQKRNSHSVQDVLIPLMSVAQDPYHQWSFSTIYEDVPLNAETSCNVLENFLTLLWTTPDNPDLTKFLCVENEQALKTEMVADTTINTDNTCALIEWKGYKMPESHESIEQKLLLTVNQLNAENNHLLALMLVCEIIPRSLAFPDQYQQHSATLLNCSQVLLRRVMAARKADLSLAIALLATAPVGDSIEWLNHSIKRVRFECNHLTRTTQLAIDYSHLKKDFRHLATLKRLHQIGVWGKRLQKLGLSNKELMKEGGRENACNVLAMMIEDCPNIELATIHQFCKDFEIRFDSAVLLCLENLIISWQPEISVVKNKFGIEEIASVNYKYVMQKAEFYVKTISEDCKRELEHKLNSIWDKLNTYHYEMYSCLLHLKSMLNPNCDRTQSQILMFLMPYKRQVRPQMQEIEKWLRFHPDDTDLPSIAKWRLPYPLFMEESKNIIAMEVNLQNYQTWLQAPAALNCDPDHICVAAIKNSTSRDISLTKMEDWCVQTRDEKLINDIAECVNHMTDMSVASAVLDHVSKRIPPGMDKLSIVEMSLQKINLWCLEAQTSESKEMEKKVSKRLLLYSTYHVLHEQGLGRTEYIALAENPSALIEALYRDPSILERGRGIAQHYPDIHNAVNMLGPLHNLNVQKIRHNLLENWLLSDMLSSGSLDDSFVDTSRVWQQFEQDISQAYDEAENDLLRARYLLETGEPEDNVDYLVGLCFSPKSTCGARVKLRALNCLFWIIPADQLSNRIGRDEVSIRDFAKTLFFLSELEQVQGQTCLSAQEFEDRNKASIVESLWRAHSQNPRALLLMCQICIYYRIYNPHVWANMLTRMQQLNLIKELEMILPKLNHVAHKLCTSQFVAAWNKVLKTPFERVDDPLTKEQEEACAHSLLLLQGCPLLKDMDMPTIFKLCLEAKRFDLAAIILPLSSSSDRVPLLRELLKLTTVEDLRNSFHKLRNYASLPIAQAQQIIENNADVILALDNSSPHFSTPPAMLI